MIVRYESSSLKDLFLNFNATPLISNKTTRVHEKVEKDNFSINTTVLKLVFKLKTHRKESLKHEDMAASILYTDYETAETNNKEDITTLPAQTIATFIINNKRPTIIVYPTVSAESVVIPIVSCILGFPLLALLIICCLRRRAKLARERDRRRNYDMQDHAVSLVRFSPIHRLNNRSSRAISLCPERSLSRGFPSLELDTVLEERSDMEQTQTEIFNSDSPVESTSQNNSCSS